MSHVQERPWRTPGVFADCTPGHQRRYLYAVIAGLLERFKDSRTSNFYQLMLKDTLKERYGHWATPWSLYYQSLVAQEANNVTEAERVFAEFLKQKNAEAKPYAFASLARFYASRGDVEGYLNKRGAAEANLNEGGAWSGVPNRNYARSILVQADAIAGFIDLAEQRRASLGSIGLGALEPDEEARMRIEILHARSKQDASLEVLPELVRIDFRPAIFERQNEILTAWAQKQRAGLSPEQTLAALPYKSPVLCVCLLASIAEHDVATSAH